MNTDLAREQMLTQQIRTCDVTEQKVLNAVRATAREDFVPAKCREVAYADAEIPLPFGQCMLRPSFVGRLLQAVDPGPTDEVLEIGTGYGYLTACLARLAASVNSVDIFPEFVAAAQKNLLAAGLDNVALECMDVMDQVPDGPYDIITITSAIPEFHLAYGELLKPGGRLFMIVGKSPARSAVLVTRKDEDNFEMDELFELDAPELINATVDENFSF